MNQFIRNFNPEIEKNSELDSFPQYECFSDGNKFRLFHQNIRSIHKNLDTLRVDSSQSKGYDLIYNEGDINKADGVEAFIRQGLEYGGDIVYIGECKEIEIKITEDNIYLFITPIYKSHEIQDVTFLSDFETYVERVLLHNFR
ncbi:hypothetical protein HHI36_022343 [Cryptolaemus montrouzieri]|uniref:Uncharacterized protein n=1 Tax=Cryptolaemus montrouzieri TaxID=559131 RepID=A0ABD2MZJ0_9CUCU